MKSFMNRYPLADGLTLEVSTRANGRGQIDTVIADANNFYLNNKD